MTDRDALAREMRVHFGQRWKDLIHAADIALRHIEAARAEERERCAGAADAQDHGGNVLPVRINALRIGAAIRAGSPAPAPPVVWTDMQVIAALKAWYGEDLRFQPSREVQDVMRAALEAASREGE